MTPAEAEIDRIADLLLEQQARSLDDKESAELERLLGRHPDWQADELELTQAAISAGGIKPEPMPAALKERLLAARPDEAPTAELAPAAPTLIAVRTEPARPRPAPRANMAWVGLALAASLALVGWWPRILARLSPVAPLSAGAAREVLLASADVRALPFTAAADPLVKSVSGDVTWSSREQKGFMRFLSGLPKNDPSQAQYQLWVFDAARDERYPVDGGVFDVASDGTVIVPITAKVRVEKPTLFAVTLERPGGVVVSTRERLLVIAKVL